ncbi:MAG: hypothetical protein IJT79_05465 [Ruminococcus sp.]|jgi:hypothetical protein|nr:hypothetical protein [Ruminococcus sp.]
MYDNDGRYEHINLMTEACVSEAKDIIATLKEEGCEATLTDVLIATLTNTLDDGGESIYTVLTEIRDSLDRINETLSLLP